MSVYHHLQIGDGQAQPTSTNSQDVNRNKVGYLGISIGQKIGGSSSAHEHVGNTKDEDAPGDHLETACLDIGNVAKNER